jgi:DNA-directed RNA polymerase subunit RPC12/RpoP
MYSCARCGRIPYDTRFDENGLCVHCQKEDAKQVWRIQEGVTVPHENKNPRFRSGRYREN